MIEGPGPAPWPLPFTFGPGPAPWPLPFTFGPGPAPWPRLFSLGPGPARAPLMEAEGYSRRVFFPEKCMYFVFLLEMFFMCFLQKEIEALFRKTKKPAGIPLSFGEGGQGAGPGPRLNEIGPIWSKIGPIWFKIGPKWSRKVDFCFLLKMKCSVL